MKAEEEGVEGTLDGVVSGRGGVSTDRLTGGGSGGRGGKAGGGGTATMHSPPSIDFFSMADGLESGGVGMDAMSSLRFFPFSSPFDPSLTVFPSSDISEDESPVLSLVS